MKSRWPHRPFCRSSCRATKTTYKLQLHFFHTVPQCTIKKGAGRGAAALGKQAGLASRYEMLLNISIRIYKVGSNYSEVSVIHDAALARGPTPNKLKFECCFPSQTPSRERSENLYSFQLSGHQPLSSLVY